MTEKARRTQPPKTPEKRPQRHLPEAANSHVRAKPRGRDGPPHQVPIRLDSAKRDVGADPSGQTPRTERHARPGPRHFRRSVRASVRPGERGEGAPPAGRARPGPADAAATRSSQERGETTCLRPNPRPHRPLRCSCVFPNLRALRLGGPGICGVALPAAAGPGPQAARADARERGDAAERSRDPARGLGRRGLTGRSRPLAGPGSRTAAVRGSSTRGPRARKASRAGGQRPPREPSGGRRSRRERRTRPGRPPLPPPAPSPASRRSARSPAERSGGHPRGEEPGRAASRVAAGPVTLAPLHNPRAAPGPAAGPRALPASGRRAGPGCGLPGGRGREEGARRPRPGARPYLPPRPRRRPP